ncbi:MAG: hypothetical protein PHP59_04910 [Methanofollis sp.]|uniref:hypothetical protein n=1 Tax=Methanofollis sp. TaxID=2052835 RepID=UPI00260CD358|nr:hypothetical protein [Methanofollis sp.]MDD4254699.1 hypothetical protein [Methanofollis sp.]
MAPSGLTADEKAAAVRIALANATVQDYLHGDYEITDVDYNTITHAFRGVERSETVPTVAIETKDAQIWVFVDLETETVVAIAKNYIRTPVIMPSVTQPISTPPGGETPTVPPTVQPTPRNDTAYLDIHPAGGRSVLLDPEDERYPTIDAECQELIRCINAQLKTGFSQEELAAMKRNSTYVALRFSQPTKFETRYIVDGSPRQITISEAVFFMDSGEEQNIIRTLAPDGPGVWTTSRDRGALKDLVAPVLAEGKKQ